MVSAVAHGIRMARRGHAAVSCSVRWRFPLCALQVEGAVRMYSVQPVPSGNISPASSSQTHVRSKVTPLDVQRMHDRCDPITMVTAYDYPTGVACERAEVDMVLIGDSLGMVALGHTDTVSVTMNVSICVHMYICTYIYKYTHTHIYIYILVCTI